VSRIDMELKIGFESRIKLWLIFQIRHEILALFCLHSRIRLINVSRYSVPHLESSGSLSVAKYTF